MGGRFFTRPFDQPRHASRRSSSTSKPYSSPVFNCQALRMSQRRDIVNKVVSERMCFYAKTLKGLERSFLRGPGLAPHPTGRTHVPFVIVGKTFPDLLDLNHAHRAGRGTRTVTNARRRPCSRAVGLWISLRSLPALARFNPPTGFTPVVTGFAGLLDHTALDRPFRSGTRYGWLLLSQPPLAHRGS